MSYLVVGVAWLDNFFDSGVVNTGFDGGCQERLARRPASLPASGWPSARLSKSDRLSRSSLSLSSCFGERKHDRLPNPHRPYRSARRRRARCPHPWRAQQESRPLDCARISALPRLHSPSSSGFTSIAPPASLQFQERYNWIPALGRAISRRHRRPRPADAAAQLHRRAHRNGRLLADSGSSAALLLARPPSPGVPLRDLYRPEFLPLVHLLGTRPHPRILPHPAVGRTAQNQGRNAIPRLHHGRQRRHVAVLPRHLSLPPTNSTSSTSPRSRRAANSCPQSSTNSPGTASRRNT